MAFPNYRPPEYPQRIGKVILYYRFLDAIQRADNEITSWVVLTVDGEFEILPYHDHENDPQEKQQILDTAVHKRTFKADSNYLGQEIIDHDALRPIFLPFLDEWRMHRRLRLQVNRKKNGICNA